MIGHAAVVGAGISGLSAAIALRSRGWAVSVHERSGAAAEGGTALGMWPEAMAALDELGVGDAVRHHSVPVEGATILHPRGDIIAKVGDDRRARLVSRARLLEILHHALPSGAVRWGNPVTSAHEVFDADLVVAADGIHSRLRASAWPGESERLLPTVAFRGVVPGEIRTVTETWGRGMLFGITPSSDHTINWFACVRTDLAPPTSSDPAVGLRRLFSTWHASVADIVSRIEDPGIDRRELSDVSLRHSYVRGNLALVGDAAHAMAPNLGRGACESLVDAVVLAQAVTADGVERGLRRYDEVRRRRTQRIVAEARALNRVATLRRGTGARDAALRLLSRRPGITS